MSEWYWDGFVRPEMLTMLAGDPKVGKTTLLEGLTRAMARGEDFLGRATSPATAVVVSEDTAWEFEERERDLGPAPERVLLLGRFAATVDDWLVVVEEALDTYENGRHGVLIVDSFPSLTGLDQRELENDAASVSHRLRPLLVATRQRGVAVVFTHHLSRRGRARGSTAFEAAPDAIVTLHRRAKQTAFDLRSRSRSQRTPVHLRGNLLTGAGPWRYEATGTSLGGDRSAVWAALEASPEGGATADELAYASGVSKRTVQNCLNGYSEKDGGWPGWVEAGYVIREGSGKAGNPYRYEPTADADWDSVERAVRGGV